MPTRTITAQPTVVELQQRLSTLRAERDTAQERARDAIASEEALTMAHRQHTGGAEQVFAHSSPSSADRAAFARSQRQLAARHEQQVAQLRATQTEAATERQRIDAELDELPRVINRLRTANERATGAGDVATLTEALRQAAAVHAQLVADLADVAARRADAFDTGDVSVVRAAHDDSVVLPVQITIAVTSVLRARAALVRAQLAAAAAEEAALVTAMQAAEVKFAEARRQRDLAHAVVRRNATLTVDLASEVRRVDAELAAHLRAGRSAVA